MKIKRGLWLVASTLIHVVVVMLALQAMLSPRLLIGIFTRNNEPMVVENVTYVTPVPPAQPPPRSTSTTRATPRVQIVPVAPTEVPSTLPAIPKVALPITADSVVSRAVDLPGGGRGGLPTLNPSNPDTRLFGSTQPLPEPPKNTGLGGMQHSLDSAMKFKRDSMSKLRNPKDWTVGEGDKKYGLDPSWIYLGKIKIPTMLLGLIPLNVQSNPQLYENSKTLGVMAAEVRERGASGRSQREEIAAINARKERERNARNRAAIIAAGGGDKKVPPP